VAFAGVEVVLAFAVDGSRESLFEDVGEEFAERAEEFVGILVLERLGTGGRPPLPMEVRLRRSLVALCVVVEVGEVSLGAVVPELLDQGRADVTVGGDDDVRIRA
jgi:hypothetical protein